MIGKILLAILLIFLAALSLALTVPIHIRAGYDRGSLSAGLRYGPLKITLFPRPGIEGAGGKKKKGKDKEDEKPEEEQPEKKKSKITSEQVFYSLDTLPPILGRALRRIGRGLRIDPLKVHLLIAGPDPADTALLYGRLQTALSAGLPVLHRHVHIENQDIQLFLDFQEPQIDCIADIGAAARGWTLARAALCAGASALKWYMGFKKLAGPPAPAPDSAPPDGAEAAG